MSVSTQISRLNSAKDNLKQSIENAGVTVPDQSKLDSFPGFVDTISSNFNSQLDSINGEVI